MASLDASPATIRCEQCGLMQFLKSGRDNCLRCRATLIEPPPPSPPEPDPIDHSQRFGHRLCLRIKAIRELKAIPQVSLAKAMGAQRTYISKLENLNIVPNLMTLDRLALALGVRLDELTDESIPAEIIARQSWAHGGEDEDLIGGLVESISLLDHGHRRALTIMTKKLRKQRRSKAD